MLRPPGSQPGTDRGNNHGTIAHPLERDAVLAFSPASSPFLLQYLSNDSLDGSLGGLGGKPDTVFKTALHTHLLPAESRVAACERATRAS